MIGDRRAVRGILYEKKRGHLDASAELLQALTEKWLRRWVIGSGDIHCHTRIQPPPAEAARVRSAGTVPLLCVQGA